MGKKRVILVGQGASGKDHARKLLSDVFGLTYGVSYTTRPPRDNEVEGSDYFFLSKEKFEEMIEQDLWYEYVDFNGWLYGTTKEQFYNQANLFIMTPAGLSHVSDEDRKESLVIFFNIPEELRRARMEGRKGNVDSIQRRLAADQKDFSNFSNWDCEIIDPYFKSEKLKSILDRHFTNQLV